VRHHGSAGSAPRRDNITGHKPDVCVRPPRLEDDPPLGGVNVLDRRGGNHHDPAVERACPYPQRRRLVARRRSREAGLGDRAHTAVLVVHRKSFKPSSQETSPAAKASSAACKQWSLTVSGSTGRPPNT